MYYKSPEDTAPDSISYSSEPSLPSKISADTERKHRKNGIAYSYRDRYPAERNIAEKYPYTSDRVDRYIRSIHAVDHVRAAGTAIMARSEAERNREIPPLRREAMVTERARSSRGREIRTPMDSLRMYRAYVVARVMEERRKIRNAAEASKIPEAPPRTGRPYWNPSGS